MQRLVTLTSIALLFLSACARRGPLSPAEVLQKATVQSAQLQSVAYDATVNLSTKNPALTALVSAEIHGSLADAGQQAAFGITADGSLQRSGVPETTFALTADVVRELQDVYMFFHSLTVTPEPPAARDGDPLMDTWWKIAEGSAAAGGTLTPDPRFLRAQASVVTVTADHGLEQLGRRDVYHYTVAIDPEALIALMKAHAEQRGTPFDATAVQEELAQLAIAGDLWIDAETFVIHRLAWAASSKQDPGALQFHLSADLRDHDAPVTITVPAASTAVRAGFFLERLLGISDISGASFLSP